MILNRYYWWPGTDLSRPIEEAIHSFSKDDTDYFYFTFRWRRPRGKGLKQAKKLLKRSQNIHNWNRGKLVLVFQQIHWDKGWNKVILKET